MKHRTRKMRKHATNHRPLLHRAALALAAAAGLLGAGGLAASSDAFALTIQPKRSATTESQRAEPPTREAPRKDPAIIIIEGDRETGEFRARIGNRTVSTRDWLEIEQQAREAHPGRAIEFRRKDGSLISRLPSTMLGVILEPIEGVAASQLGIAPGQAVVLDQVFEGLPADEAGLRQYDVLVSCNGVQPLTKEKLSDVLSNAEPGDRLNFILLRQGHEVELEVPLRAYNPRLARGASGKDMSRITVDLLQLLDPPPSNDGAGASLRAGGRLPAGGRDQILARIHGEERLIPFEFPRTPTPDLEQVMHLMSRSGDEEMKRELRRIRQRLETVEAMLKLLLEERFAPAGTSDTDDADR